MLFIQYLAKLSISLSIVWLFYQFVLRKLTFYNSNRWYLLGYTLLCFFIPFIDISGVLQKNEWTASKAVSWVPVIEDYSTNKIVAIPSPDYFTTWNIISLLLVAGMLVMFLRLLFQLISFRQMMKKATSIPGENVNLFQVNEKIIPFSFGNSIFINQHLHSAEELQEIIRHEFVHVKQKHSIDIIWGELLCLINWYNPFAWLLKRSIRQNLEFIADNKVLENGINKKQYQYLLLKVIGNNQFSIAPKFNFSSLKKRIAMMNKLKTAKLHLVRFLFILPLLAVVLLSFRKQISDSLKQNKGKENVVIISGNFTDTIPGELNEKGYIIDVIGQRTNATVIVKDKNGELVEKISYNKWKDNEKFYNDKYGELPPPPPPPLPPTPPDPPQPMELPENVTKIDVTDKKATLTLTDGKTERYDLNNPEDKAVFEKKYGQIIPTPPTPPVPPKLPDYVMRIDRHAEFVEIWLKDGTKESYNLKVPSEKAAFEKKYGKTLPLSSESLQSSANEFELSATQEVNRRAIADNFDINDGKAHIRLKDGTVENYDLTNTEEKKKFETKYGKIIEIGASVEGVNEPVRVIGYTANGKVSNEPVTVVGYEIEKSNEPVTAISTDGTRTVIVPTKIAGEGDVTFLNDEGKIISGEEDVLVTITKRTTREELDGFVKQMKEKSIELKFDKIDYNNGILVGISGTMTYKNGSNSFSVTDFNKLTLLRIKSGDRLYLKVDTRDNKTVS